MEPHSRGNARPDRRTGAERARPVPRERAVTFTDTKGYFVSETSVYRLLKAHDLITSPTSIVIANQSSPVEKDTGALPLCKQFHAQLIGGVPRET